jgi:hypothetical protein
MLGRSDEAREHLDAAIREAPDEPNHHASLGALLRHQGRPAEAIESYDRALALQGDHAAAAVGRALALLSQGRFAEAWPGFERRFEVNPRAGLNLSEPRWEGGPLAGRTLLIDAEPSLADTIQFVRLVKKIERDGGKLALAVPEKVTTLLAESGFEGLTVRDEPLVKFDVQRPLLSLPGILGLKLNTIPAEVPYLAVGPERAARWRGVVEPGGGLKVGIAWRGGGEEAARLNSAGLADFAPLAKVAGVTLVSLEQEMDAEEEGFPHLVRLAALESSAEPLADTAAVIKNLDLVIAVDSPTAHLAGALAAPVWVALEKVPHWRWLLDRDDSPW